MKLFGTRILQSLIGMSIIALTIGCNREPDTHTVSGDIKTRIPFAAEGGAYKLQEVRLSGITSLYEFSGQYVKFYIYPSITNRKLTGHQPKARFLKSGDVYVPEDIMSQQLAVIYAHFQRFAALDAELGAGDVNTWPRDVGISVRYRDNDGFQTNNAFYDGSIDAMLVVPYTQDNLPIAVNAGILAHEHFHSLYYKLVEKHVFKAQMALHGKELREEILSQKIVENFEVSKVTNENNPDSMEQYHRNFSRAINEGLADFWAWIYTGDPDFLQVSLPQEKKYRHLHLSEKAAKDFVFPSANIWKMELENRGNAEAGCGGDRFAYCLGTKYARLLKHLSGVVQTSRGLTSQEARKVVGAGIIRALPLLKDALLNLKSGEYFEPASFFTLLAVSMPEIEASEKEFLQRLVKNSIKKTNADEKSVRTAGREEIPTGKPGPPPLIPDLGATQ